MVISYLEYGFGNQMIQYIVGRSLALKLNTEFKITFSADPSIETFSYRLGNFNVVENLATPEELKHVAKNGVTPNSYEELENIQGDVLIKGIWMLHKPLILDTFASDPVIKKEFTLKKPFTPVAEAWRKKILATECSVSMHFRHGDYVYSTRNYKKWAPILPLDYYCTCINLLKERYGNLTVFVFSDNIPWVRENLRLEVPIEFVEDCNRDLEEWVLMSLCKHNIVAMSTFSETAAWINSNPDKKVFLPGKSNINVVKRFLNSLTPANKNSLLDSSKYIYVPYSFADQPEITTRPYLSILLVVNNDIATISEALDSILEQDYKWYEIIIIDNASTDGSREICRQKTAGKKNVILKRFHSKVPNTKAWNIALDMAQGHVVSFLKGNDRFLPNSLSSVFYNTFTTTICASFSYLEENANGNVSFNNKKLLENRDTYFQKVTKAIKSNDGQEAVKLLTNHSLNGFLGTKMFYRDFLLKNKIRFDKTIDDAKAELLFQITSLLKTDSLQYAPHTFYIAPKTVGSQNN